MTLKITNIPSSSAFAEVLAGQVLARYGESPQVLSRVLLLLPSRRAIRHLREAFLRVTEGRALLLPQMAALGDFDEKFLLRYAGLSPERLTQLVNIPPAVESLERLVALAKLVQGYQRNTTFDQALELADQLAEMLDELQREQVDMAGFDTLVPSDFAEQWQQTLEFLKIIREYWPQMLAEKGVIDPWQRKNQLIALLAQSWANTSPDFPVIAAGTTGSIPAIAQLLKVIAGLPQGEIILPGLDTEMDGASYAQIEESHPQYGLKHLLETLGVGRDAVFHLSHRERSKDAQQLLGEGSTPSPDSPATSAGSSTCPSGRGATREHFLSLALQPATTTEHWRSISLDASSALENLHYLPCKDARQESLTVALLLREVLETPTKTAALVTADRSLARQVAAQLHRWGIAIDDSAGKSLHLTPVGNFILLLLECVEEGNAPVNLLSLLKHPLARLGYEPAEIRSLVRQLEREALRGLKPNGLADMQSFFCGTSCDGECSPNPTLRASPCSDGSQTNNGQKISELLKQLETALEPLAYYAVEAGDFSAQAMLRACVDSAEMLAGKAILWQGEEAREISKLLETLPTALEGVQISFREFRGVMAQMLRRGSFRSAWNGHPRLQILSPMESRILQCDRVVLGGLNEGSWPAKTEAEPWLNRPMRKALGLSAPERQIGLLAHDFAMLAALPEVYLTRAEKSEGAAMVPSRFIQRMEAVLQLAGATWKSEPHAQWAEAMDTPTMLLPPLLPPAPRPPLSARPRQLSVTAIERLIRDPYGIYAQKILRLKALDPLQQMPEAREFGEAAHQALENFTQQPTRSLAALLAEGDKAFAPFGDAFMVEALWKPRFVSIAEWVLQQEWPLQSLCEVEGTWVLQTPRGDFTLTARVDRIDVTPEGVSLVDYKTGTPPTQREMELGLANQLVLAAIMVQQGGFGAELAHRPIVTLSYWRLSGARKGGEIKGVKLPEAAIAEAAEKLPALLAKFDNPNTPYRAIPDARNQPKYNDYAHLARIAEWVGGGG